MCCGVKFDWLLLMRPALAASPTIQHWVVVVCNETVALSMGVKIAIWEIFGATLPK
jgi:hypothetical protein